MAALQPQSVRRISLPVPLAEAVRAMLAGLEPVAERLIDLSEAKGLCLARALVTPGPAPLRSVALRSGAAVSAHETAGATPYSPALLGTRPVPVLLGEDLPLGADAVLPHDAVAEQGGVWEAFEEAPPGEWVRRTGEDLRKGLVLRPAGEAITAMDIVIGSVAGIETCMIRQPVLAVPSGFLSASPALRLIASLAQASGAAVLTPMGDHLDPSAHLMLTMQPLEKLVASLTGEGGQMAAPRLALRPGEEAALARVGSCRIVSAPDRIADWLAVWLTIVLPCLHRLAGSPPNPHRDGRLIRKVSSTVGLSEIVLLRENADGFEPLATGDLPLSAIAAANFWMVVPPESEGFPSGHIVSAQRLGPR